MSVRPVQESNQGSTAAHGAPVSQASTGSFWSRHKVTILTVGGGVVGGVIATALIATGVGAALIALPIIAKFAWAAACGMLIGGLVGLGVGYSISDLRWKKQEPVLSEDRLQQPKFQDEQEPVGPALSPTKEDSAISIAISSPSISSRSPSPVGPDSPKSFSSQSANSNSSSPSDVAVGPEYKLRKSDKTRRIDTESLPLYDFDTMRPSTSVKISSKVSITPSPTASNSSSRSSLINDSLPDFCYEVPANSNLLPDEVEPRIAIKSEFEQEPRPLPEMVVVDYRPEPPKGTFFTQDLDRGNVHDPLREPKFREVTEESSLPPMVAGVKRQPMPKLSRNAALAKIARDNARIQADVPTRCDDDMTLVNTRTVAIGGDRVPTADDYFGK